MHVIILGDRFKRGLKSKGCPGLIKIDDSFNIFDNQHLIITNRFPNSKILYVAGFDLKRMRAFLKKRYPSVDIIKNEHYMNFSDSQSLGVAGDYLCDDLLIVSGYSLLNSATFKGFVVDEYSKIFTSDKPSKLGCITQNSMVTNISFGLPHGVLDLYYISSRDVQHLKNLAINRKYGNHFLFELINNLIDHDVVVRQHKIVDT